MRHPSYAPSKNATHEHRQDASAGGAPAGLRHSRPPARFEDEALTEDELFAIWQAHLQ